MAISANFDSNGWFRYSTAPFIRGSNPFNLGQLAKAIYSVDNNAKHVAKNGSDVTGDGSLGNPWLTVQYGLDNVALSETLYIHAGTYQETVTRGDFAGLHASIGGTSSKYHRIEGWPGDTVILDQQGTGVGLVVLGHDYVAVRNLIVENCLGDGIAFDGVSVGNPNTGAIVQDCIVRAVAGSSGQNVSAIQLNQTVDFFVYNNVLYDISIDGAYTNNNCCGVQSYQGDNGTVARNTIFQTARGVYHKQAITDGIGWVIEYNDIYNVDEGIHFGISGGTDPAHDNGVIRHNLLRVKNTGIDCYEDQITGVHDNMHIYNNTIIPYGGISAQAGAGISIDAITNSSLYNNLIVGNFFNTGGSINTGDSGETNMTINFNGFFNETRFYETKYSGTAHATLAAWSASTGYDANSLSANPQFVDDANGNFRLQGTSPFINRGMGGVTIGAYITGDEQIGSDLQWQS